VFVEPSRVSLAKATYLLVHSGAIPSRRDHRAELRRSSTCVAQSRHSSGPATQGPLGEVVLRLASSCRLLEDPVGVRDGAARRHLCWRTVRGCFREDAIGHGVAPGVSVVVRLGVRRRRARRPRGRPAGRRGGRPRRPRGGRCERRGSRCRGGRRGGTPGENERQKQGLHDHARRVTRRPTEIPRVQPNVRATGPPVP
jgi:hypothetical protein